LGRGNTLENEKRGHIGPAPFFCAGVWGQVSEICVPPNQVDLMVSFGK